MKKTVSINIGGVVFHIEEDAYEKLKKYLSDISSHFSKYSDSKEIVSDIEFRIAEVFLKKLKGKKQSLNMADVEEITKTMGSVKDFEMEVVEETEKEEIKEDFTPPVEESFAKRKLFRDVRRKILGGVCSGIAHYLSIDPLWIRLLFLALFFGFWFIPPASGIALIGYLVLWAVTPASGELEEDNTIKRLYRNPEERVIGGVSSGIAAFFGTDPLVIRLLFVLSVLVFGFGILLYIILWMITPEAQSTTDKMRMRGEPVTLSNIETAVKKSFSNNEGEEENILVKIILFPFRILGQIFEALAKLLGPLLVFLVEAIRVITGLFLAFISIVGVFALVVAFMFVMGVAPWPEVTLDGITASMVQSFVTVPTAIGVFLGGLIPTLAIGLLGIRFLAKRPIYNSAFLWSLVGVWMIGLLMSALTVPRIALSFAEDSDYQTTETYEVQNEVIHLDVNNVGMEDYEGVRLRIRPHSGDDIRLEYSYSASGTSESEALENAKAIDYEMKWVGDSVMVFDSNIKLKEDAVFRGQELDLTLYMPIGQKFVLPSSIVSIIYNTVYRYHYNVSDIRGNTFFFSDPETLECEGCDPNSGNRTGSDKKEMVFNSPFTTLDIAGHFNVIYTQGKDNILRMEGREEQLAEVEVIAEEENLSISYEAVYRGKPKRRSMVTLIIESPDLSSLELSGYNELNIASLNTVNFSLALAGVVDAEVKADVDNMEVQLEGKSNLELDGEASSMDASLSGVSELDAEYFKTERAIISTSGTSKARIHAKESLDATARGISEIIYSGNPSELKKDKNGLAKISRR